MTNASSSTIALEVKPSPDYEIGNDYVELVYEVRNTGTTKLCNIFIKNSLPGVATPDPFDLEPEGNSTLSVGYRITSEDRESPYLVSDVMAEACSCETGQVVATSCASCAVVVIQPS
jgi:hypothetical protein